MFQLDLKGRKSIYEQIVDNVKELIISGVLLPDEKIPSVRELSKMLTVNPNTIQKAYRELENQRYLYTVAGLGCFVAQKDERRVDLKKVEDIKEQIRAALSELRYLGMEDQELCDFLQQLLAERRASVD